MFDNIILSSKVMTTSLNVDYNVIFPDVWNLKMFTRKNYLRLSKVTIIITL